MLFELEWLLIDIASYLLNFNSGLCHLLSKNRNLSDEIWLVVNYERIKYTEFFVNPSIQDEKLIHESILQEENLPNY